MSLQPDRVVPLAGAYNFRDLGGYPAGGGHTRWRRVFRSDTLQHLTTADLELLRDLGLRTVIDLRTPAEATRDGRGPLAAEPLHYVNLSVLPTEGGESTAAPNGDDVAERYLWYLEAGRHALATAFTMLCDGDGHPAVFHCTAGKDRTGVLSALVLGCLGVPDHLIVDDYMATLAPLPRILDRLRRHPVYGPQMAAGDTEGSAEQPPPRFLLEPSTMERFLAALRQRYGGAAGWARDAGIPDTAVRDLRRLMIDEHDPA